MTLHLKNADSARLPNLYHFSSPHSKNFEANGESKLFVYNTFPFLITHLNL
jgi:hypothetical protein